MLGRLALMSPYYHMIVFIARKIMPLNKIMLDAIFSGKKEGICN